MPETVVDTPVTDTETFSSFRGNRGSTAPVEVKVEVPDVTKTGSPATEEQDDSSSNDSDPQSKAVDGSDPSQKQDKVERRKAKIQAEIDGLVAEREKVRREVETVRAGKPAETLSGQAAAPSAKADDKPAYPDAADPKYAGDYAKWKQDEIKWTIETAKWEIREEGRQVEAKAQADRQQAQQKAAEEANKKILDEFQSRSDAYAEEHPDYVPLLEKAQKTQMSNETAAAITQSEEGGPELLHYLMEHPDEMKKIDSQPTIWKRIEAVIALRNNLLKPEPEPAKEKPVSQAPRTGTRVSGGGPSSSSKEPTSFGSFRKQRFG